jgi:hypothetical protein
MLERKDSATLPEKISIMTFNIACLPFLGAINAKFLRLNRTRTNLIIERLMQWHQHSGPDSAPDILCFQEAMAPETRLLLKQKLTTHYPHHTDNLGVELMRGSGLYIFSKFPILESIFIQYNNQKVGEETLAIKGFMGVKLKISDNQFITVFTTHLEADGAILGDKQQNKTGKTNSYERGEEMGILATTFKTWGINPPKDSPTMQHCKTFISGDFNTPLNDARRMYSISTGNAKNNFKKNMVKYPGQKELFQHFELTVPVNFFEVRDVHHYKDHVKQVVPELLAQAKLENKFIGTYIGDKVSKENKDSFRPIKPYDAECNVIDGVFCSQFTDAEKIDWNVSDTPGTFQSKIISMKLDGQGGESDLSLSDHFPIVGTWQPKLFKAIKTLPDVKKHDSEVLLAKAGSHLKT